MPENPMAGAFHLIPYSSRMWVLCSGGGTRPGEVVPLIYRGRATMWFSEEALGRAFVQAVTFLAESSPCLVPVEGIEALHRWAGGLLREGVVDIFFDLTPHGRAQAESLEGFVEDLRARLEGNASSVRN